MKMDDSSLLTTGRKKFGLFFGGVIVVVFCFCLFVIVNAKSYSFIRFTNARMKEIKKKGGTTKTFDFSFIFQLCSSVFFLTDCFSLVDMLFHGICTYFSFKKY